MSKIRLASPLLILLGSFFLIDARPAHAACLTARSISSVNEIGATYIYTPGFPYGDYAYSTSPHINGVFWSLGSGNPAVGVGNDSGTNVGRFSTDNSNWLTTDVYGGTELFFGAGLNHWQIPGTDGCIDVDGTNPQLPDSGQCLAVLLGDTSAGSSQSANSYFSLILQKPTEEKDYGLGVGAGDYPINRAADNGRISLTPVPQPEIVSLQKSANGVTASVRVSASFDKNHGAYLNCQASQNSSIASTAQFKIYSRAIASTTPFNDTLSVANSTWKIQNSGTALNNKTPTLTLPCSAGEDVLLCASLAFDTQTNSGFETPFCSKPVRIACGTASVAPEPASSQSTGTTPPPPTVQPIQPIVPDPELQKRLRGHILLQVESRGEAWYVDPISERRAYLASGSSAYQLLRTFGLGISNANLEKIPVGITASVADTDTDNDGLSDKLEEALGSNPNNVDTDGDGFNDLVEIQNGYSPLNTSKVSINASLVNQLRGRILLQVENRGQAWYLNPRDGKRYYMKNGAAAFQIMRLMSLGITNQNLQKIAIFE